MENYQHVGKVCLISAYGSFKQIFCVVKMSLRQKTTMNLKAYVHIYEW